MIERDQVVCDLCRIFGSVIPRSIIWGVLGAVEGALLDLSDWRLFAYRVGPSSLGDSHRELWHHPYSVHVFGMVIGFALVMRVQIAYARFWEAATNLKMMSSKMGDACMQIITFDEARRADGEAAFDEASLDFRLQIVHFASLYHGVALSEIRQDDLEIGGQAALALNREDPYLFSIFPTNVASHQLENRWNLRYGSTQSMRKNGLHVVGAPEPDDDDDYIETSNYSAASSVRERDSNVSVVSFADDAEYAAGGLLGFSLGASQGLPPSACSQRGDPVAARLADAAARAAQQPSPPGSRNRSPHRSRPHSSSHATAHGHGQGLDGSMHGSNRRRGPASPSVAGASRHLPAASANVPMQQVLRARRRLNQQEGSADGGFNSLAPCEARDDQKVAPESVHSLREKSVHKRRGAISSDRDSSGDLSSSTIRHKHAKHDVRPKRDANVTLCEYVWTTILLLGSTRSGAKMTASNCFDVVGGVSEVEIQILSALPAADRTFVIFTWILRLMVARIGDGGLAIPPPLLSRTYQVLSDSMAASQQALKLSETPFPYPLRQLLAVLLIAFQFLVPMAIAAFIDSPPLVAVISFFVCLGYMALNETARELEHPFGLGANHLPTVAYQESFNAKIARLLDLTVPQLGYVPTLSPAEEMQLEQACSSNHLASSGVSPAPSPPHSQPQTPPGAQRHSRPQHASTADRARNGAARTAAASHDSAAFGASDFV